MKKKVALLTLIFSLVFASGYVLAASKHGSFKGFPIVKLFIEGKEVRTDVPSISINGTTMVPLKVISEQFGKSVNYDAKANAVYIGKGPAKHTDEGTNLFDIYDLDAEATESGTIILTGKIQNTSNKTLSGWFDIIGYAKDKNGKEIGKATTSMNNLKPGQSKDFKVEFYDLKEEPANFYVEAFYK